MGKLKYDRDLLDYVEAKRSARYHLLRALKFAGITLALVGVYFVVFTLVFSSDEEKRMISENRLIEDQYAELESQTRLLEEAVEELGRKDEDIYMVPQENGARTGVVEASVSGDGMPALRLSTPGSMVFSAGHWTPNELENARHFWQLPPVTRTIVRCAAGVRGAGGDDSWGALPLEPYRYTLHRGDSFTLTLWVE